MDYSLIEKLVLLATHDEKGTSINDSWGSLDYTLAGAALFEMDQAQLLCIESNQVAIVEGATPGNAWQALVLEQIQKSKKAKDLKQWIAKLADFAPKIKALVLEELVSKGILKKEDHRYVWIFHTERFPTQNPLPELKIRKRLEQIIEGEDSLTEDEYVLLGLVQAANLVKEVFPKALHKVASQRIKDICESEIYGSTVSKVIEEIQSAITAVIVSTAVVAAVS